MVFKVFRYFKQIFFNKIAKKKMAYSIIMKKTARFYNNKQLANIILA